MNVNVKMLCDSVVTHQSHFHQRGIEHGTCFPRVTNSVTKLSYRRRSVRAFRCCQASTSGFGPDVIPASVTLLSLTPFRPHPFLFHATRHHTCRH